MVLQVTPNLYGNLVANTAAGIAGGTGVMPGGKIKCFIVSDSKLIFFIAFLKFLLEPKLRQRLRIK